VFGVPRLVTNGISRNIRDNNTKTVGLIRLRSIVGNDQFAPERSTTTKRCTVRDIIRRARIFLINYARRLGEPLDQSL